MLKLARYLKYYKKEAIWGAFLKWVEAAVGLAVPLIIANLIDNGISNNNRQVIISSGLILFALAVVGMASALTCQYLASKASQGIGTILRREMVERINSLSHTEVDQYGKSGLLTRATNDIFNIERGTAMIIRLLFRSPFIVVGALIMAFIVNVKLALIFVVVIPIVIFALFIITTLSAKLFRNIQLRLDYISLLTGEVMTGTRVIRAFNKQEYEINKLSTANKELREYSEKSGLLGALLSPINNIILNLGIAAILFFGARLAGNGEVSRGEVVANINYMTEIILQMVVVSFLAVILTRGSQSATRVNEVLALSATTISGKADAPTLQANAVEFRNVSFSYPTSKECTLKNVSFTIEKGEKVGLIGTTGSGKTTLINLILNFYQPSKGDILIGDMPIGDWSTFSLRQNIAYAPQKVAIFADTIKENVLWGRPQATDNEVIDALKTAQAYDFVSKLDKGIQQKCLQDGRNFSGGQKQRIALARTVIKDAPIIILDDSTSALDYKTSRDFYTALKERGGEATWLVVSQRVNAVKDMDKIMVLEDGQLVGSGSHDILLAQNKVYREIVDSQQGGEIIE